MEYLGNWMTVNSEMERIQKKRMTANFAAYSGMTVIFVLWSVQEREWQQNLGYGVFKNRIDSKFGDVECLENRMTVNFAMWSVEEKEWQSNVCYRVS